jgi:carboxyl-terminal processing protease
MTRLKRSLLLLALELFCFGPAFFQQNVDRGNRSIDDYWTETDLTSTELETLLANEICYSDKISYLACANAINQIVERFGVVLTTTGKLKDITLDDIENKNSEKQALAPWAEAWDQNHLMKHPTFLELWKQIDVKYSKKQTRAALIASGLNGYLSIAKDPHSYILPLDFYEQVISKSDSHQYNLGFIARRAKEYAVVRKVFEGSPAEKAGLRKGDHIVRINGFEVSHLLQNQFLDFLKVKDGDRLSVQIQRSIGENKPPKDEYFEIMKSNYITPSVSSNMLEGIHKTGVLTLHKFAKNTCNQAREHLISLIEQGAEGLLLDVRDNPGGQVEEAACVLNLFIAKGKLLFETRYMDPLHPVDRYFTQTNPIYKGPLAVLINSGSASASEIVAGTLKDLNRATLVGEKTFGKGSFQDGRLWGAHSRIAVFETEGLYYFPSGWTPQLVGIEPDIKVDFSDVSSYRESEMFFNPVVPKDIWNGPQSITWIQLMQCQDNAKLWNEQLETSSTGEDPQVIKAREWLNCKSATKVGSMQ